MPVNRKKQQGKDAAVSLPVFMISLCRFKQDQLSDINFNKYGFEMHLKRSKVSRIVILCRTFLFQCMQMLL